MNKTKQELHNLLNEFSMCQLPFFMLLLTTVRDMFLKFLQEKPKYYQSAPTGAAPLQ
jgi:hypothetical protein